MQGGLKRMKQGFLAIGIAFVGLDTGIVKNNQNHCHAEKDIWGLEDKLENVADKNQLKDSSDNGHENILGQAQFFLLADANCHQDQPEHKG